MENKRLKYDNTLFEKIMICESLKYHFINGIIFPRNENRAERMDKLQENLEQKVRVSKDAAIL